MLIHGVRQVLKYKIPFKILLFEVKENLKKFPDKFLLNQTGICEQAAINVSTILAHSSGRSNIPACATPASTSV